ncbi:bifunctional diaminohydroxyphosphoribosylaminopyrimidine deaminase/5-amino-6-(5-phosphoribosylamino)uracil reductase RibD [Domibacillus epiphyticus]|uniref:Riboflavin biosynthesis protein RibD n=1 Tax=Domibacillus epiphyticus TaxID=1714355 RepID=A0A1V2A505_9BACI|nr:bifunctional diaminohydroxyphosphoribosylaminopyrimidine deaminase/5-amino-6-(5-phosphoribosylamino)uracil reductase RibD [Domibacillus epiphyticus]OMP66101.1 riboflavin biosynthesis protein RibD [Domibacillus epiphyticus]
MQEEYYMNLALSLAKGAAYQTSPNPPVGAVVVKDGRVIGMGAHLKAGEAHAEVNALAQAGAEAEGADIYVTLEPCAHFGKTPPCANLVIEKGIRRVFIAAVDPNPLVGGKGIEKIRAAGIEVTTGICEKEAIALLTPFFHFIQTKRPYVTIKTAVTADGKTAAHTGHSRWITSDEAREDVHLLRSQHDAILTGIGTVLLDNPLLTSRLPHGGKHPIRVLLDTHLRVPVDFHIIQNKEAKTIIFCASDAQTKKQRQLEDEGVTVIRLSHMSIDKVLDELGKMGIMTLFVEAGAEINASFLDAGSFNKLIMYMAPKLIGGKSAPSSFGGLGGSTMDEALAIDFTSVEMIGPDLKIVAERRGM